MTHLLQGILTAVLLAGWWQAGAEQPPPPTGSHGELECAECHGDDGLADCDSCHDDATFNIHPVNMRPEIPIPPNFRLGPDGTLRCHTCHRLHGGDPESGFLNTLAPGEDRPTFCARCHGEKLAQINPHMARRASERCAYCHAAIPDAQADAEISARLDIVRLCDFCHGALAKDHPRNIDPALKLPRGLPLAPDGSWTCVTCHEPHGTTQTTHYVRTEFAQHYERGLQTNPHIESYFACQACHTTSIPREIQPPGFALRYKGDINVLCVSCHVTDRGHHPTGLPPPAFMLEDIAASPLEIPLDPEGRMTCYTCHTNNCASGRQHMSQRHYDRVNLETDLCWICHRQAEFAKVNPHVDDDRLCTHCHESRPIPGVPSLMTVPKMVCIQCHRVKPHPAGADHLREPSAKIDPDESLPLGPGDEVTCVTCHDTHANPKVSTHRLRAPHTEICSLCHWR